METNEEIKEQYSELVISKDDNKEVEAIVGSNMDFSLNAAKDSEKEIIINTIWAWWDPKSQKRKNDTTVRIISRTDIVKLVSMIYLKD